MKIVFFLWDFGRGGAETVAFNLTNYLCEKGNKVHILTINSKDELSGRLDKRVRFTTFNKKRIISSLIPLIRFMRTENIDRFIANTCPVTILSVIASFFCSGFRQKLFLIEHCDLGEEFKHRSKLFRLFLRLSISFLYNQASKVITVSNGVGEDLIRKGLRREKTKVIYDPAYPNIAKNKLNDEEGKKKWFKQDCLKISAVGHPHKQKNYPNLINAVDILKTEKKIIMLDHDDLFSSIIRNHEDKNNFQKYIKKLIDFCRENDISLLRTVGVMFSDDESRTTQYEK